jgi:parvulin-like peptidyl-prolyl isomerase
MMLRLLAAAMACAALDTLAEEPARTPPEPDPVAWAVLRTPLPADQGPCAVAKAADGTARVALFSREGAKCPAARVSDDLVTLDELVETLTMSHGAARGDAPAPGALGPNVERALARLVDLRLIVHEAYDMGLVDEVAEAKKAVTELEAVSLRTLLERRASAAAAPDPAEVERLTRDAVREWNLFSLLFPKRKDAEAFRARAAGAPSFEKLAREEIAKKRAQGTGETEWVRASAMLPQLRTAVAKLKNGAVSPAVAVEKGFVVVRLVGARYPDADAERERAAARSASLERQRFLAVERLYADLEKKHAKIDRKLLGALDFEAKKPGFAALQKDERVLVRYSSGAPLRVSDLAGALSKKFFHGMERPIEEQRVNTQKPVVFQELVRARVAELEAAEQRLSEAPEYVKAMTEYRRAVAFSTFVEKVLVPGVKVTEQDIRKEYDAHQAEFLQPEMLKLDGLAFTSAAAARSGLERLQGGTDLAWMRGNAEGQAKPDAVAIQLDGRTVSVSALPPVVRNALAGATKGDLRLLEDSGVHYVVKVVDQVPARTRPYEQVRDDLAKRLFNERVTRAVQEYADKLRKERTVEIFLVRVES